MLPPIPVCPAKRASLALAVACRDVDVRNVKALIIGPHETPYEFGFFEVGASTTCSFFSVTVTLMQRSSPSNSTKVSPHRRDRLVSAS